jgi:hypothetical protein
MMQCMPLNPKGLGGLCQECGVVSGYDQTAMPPGGFDNKSTKVATPLSSF